MKILIIGFPRSGTTLSYRIFQKHPQINGMLFERQSLKKSKTKEHLIKRYPLYKRKNCGEKVIWEKRVMGKIGIGDKFDIIDYANRWNDFFGKEARIIQIVRHPYDSLNSLVMSKKRLPRGPGFNLVYKEYLANASRFFEGLYSIPNCLTIKYETLIEDSEQTIKKYYSHCNLDVNHKHPEKMKKGRVFNYKEKDFLFKYDKRLHDIIHTLNKLPGVKYEL